MPKIPESLTDKLNPLVSRVTKVNPAVAKESATKGATGVKDILQLSVGYLKQETKEPIRGIGRYIAWGSIAAIFLGMSGILLSLALLRGIQSGLAYVRESGRGPLSGSWSFAPYLLTALACIIVLGLIGMAASKATTRSGDSK